MVLVAISVVVLVTNHITVVTSQTFFKLEHGIFEGEKFSIQKAHFECERDQSCTRVKYNKETKQSGLVHGGDEIVTTAKENEVVWRKVPFGSCKSALPAHINEGLYWIRSKNMAMALRVRCIRTEGKVFAAFSHDSEAWIKVDGFEGPGSYKRVITYKTNLQDIKKFVDSSSACKQFTRIDCHNMRLDGKGYLVDRDGLQMSYFGGGPSTGSGCSCGITKKCEKIDILCHCDVNDSRWRFDEGYVRDKKRLPLTQVRLGDTGGVTERGAHTVGKLFCEE